MEGKLNPLQQLDAALKYLNEINGDGEFTTEVLSVMSKMNNEPNVITEDILFTSFRKHPSSFISHTNLSKVVEKLIDDKYIKRDENNGHLSIKWEGRLFISRGGYVGREMQLLQSEKALELATKQVNIGYRLSWVLVVCGVLASVYYLAELLRPLLNFLHHCE